MDPIPQTDQTGVKRSLLVEPPVVLLGVIVAESNVHIPNCWPSTRESVWCSGPSLPRGNATSLLG